jgi:tetrahydromethanopterin S-methyltransferase subunit G
MQNTASFFLSCHLPFILQEKPARVPVMNGMMRLIWTYCFRCNEAPSTATAKLEPILRHFFPANRNSVVPHDDRLEPFIFILHYIMSRHLDFGTDFCMELLNEGPIRNSQSQNISHLLAPERISIAIQSILLSLYVIEKEESSPPWPSSSEFSHPPVRKDMEMSSDVLPPSALSHAGVKDLMDRCGPTLALIASSCAHNVGNMLVLGDQWSYARINPSYEEAQDYITRRHPEGTVTYPISLVPQINVLKLCFQAWPRLLHSSLPLNDALDMLIRATVHVEPMVRDIAEATLKRFMADPEHASTLLSRFATLLFDPSGISNEVSGLKMFVDSKRLLNSWAELVEEWIQGILQNASKAPPTSSPTATGSLTEEEWKKVERRLEEIEAAGLFLLTNVTAETLSVGVKIIRMLGIFYTQLGLQASTVINALHGRTSRLYITGFDDHLEDPGLERLEQWRASKKEDVPLRVADSDDIRDRDLWDHIYSSIIQGCMDHPTPVLIKFREMLIVSATKYHPFIASSAGLSSRAPRSTTVGGTNAHNNAGQPKLGPADTSIHVYQWRSWVKIICVTASVSDSRPVLNNVASINTPRDHARVLSDNNFDRERMTTSRGLFRYFAPFLDAEHSVFRHAAVFCISSLPPHGYPQLLEDLNSLAQRQFFDESRSKSAQSQPVAGRTRRHIKFYTAVTRIYFLTANLLLEQRSSGRQAALSHVLKFVRQTQSYLMSPENTDLYSLQRLRRYFCGTVERVFEGLETLKDSDRFIPPKIHLLLYRLCEEWCQFGKQSDVVKRRLILMQKTAATDAPEPQLQAEAIERFQTETKQLSSAAVGALASLCVRFLSSPSLSA